jgi:hypothetical protein
MNSLKEENAERASKNLQHLIDHNAVDEHIYKLNVE